LFFSSTICIFFPDSPTEVTRRPILTHNGSSYTESRKDVPFWGPHHGRPHLGGQITKKNLRSGAWLGNPKPSWRKVKILYIQN